MAESRLIMKDFESYLVDKNDDIDNLSYELINAFVRKDSDKEIDWDMEIIGEIEEDVRSYLLETLKSLDMTVLAMEIMPDHIHLLVDCKPQLRLSDAVKILKGNTARWLFLKHPEIKQSLWGGHLWNPSYFVATVSDRTLEQVEKYIKNQKKS